MRVGSLHSMHWHGGARAPRRATARLTVIGLLAALCTALACLAAPSAHAATLHSQYDSYPVLSPTVATPSHVTEVPYGPWSYKLALDDFVVPKGRRWTIDGVDVRGRSVDGAPLGGFGISIYKYAVNRWTGGPSKNHVASAYVAPAGGSTATNLRFNVRLGSLPSGRYWLQVVGSSPWSWADRTRQFGVPAAWTAGAGAPSVPYVGHPLPGDDPTMIRCSQGVLGYRGADCRLDPSNPDQVFRLRGTSVTG